MAQISFLLALGGLIWLALIFPWLWILYGVVLCLIIGHCSTSD